MSRSQKILQRFRIGPYELAALGIIAFTVLLRILLIANGWPETDSDEGTMGLEAMHIAFRGEHPVFLYGQNYMGMIEAYVGAFLFRLFGVSLFNLRLGMILLFTLFLVSMYCLTSLLYSKKLALLTLALLSVGARNVLLPEIRAVGGAMETLLFGSLVMLLASWLALTAGADLLPKKRRLRLLAYTCWGLATGLGLWSHLLVVPFVLTSGLLLLMFCRRDIRSLAPLCLLIGFVIGAMPLIYYNITSPLNQNSLAVALSIQGGNGIAQQVTLAKQLSGTLLFSLPEATGFSPFCGLQELPLFGPASSQTALCIVTQGSWSLGYIALLIIAACLAIIPLWKLWHMHRASREEWASDQHQATIIHMARLFLLCGAAMTLVLFALSPLAAERPWSTRYLIGLLIAMPAVLWPLWNGIGIRSSTSTSAHASRSAWSRWGSKALRIGLLLLIAMTFVGGTLNNLHEIPGDQSLLQQDTMLTHDLLQRNIKHISAGYWVCDRLIFASQEQIICNVVDLQLHEGLNRYTPYIAIVKADSTAPYVFPVGSDFAQAAAHNAVLNSANYRRFTLDGYVVYQPVGT